MIKPIKFQDVFGQRDLDFSSGKVDLIDIFNNTAEQVNKLDPLDIVAKAQEEQEAFFDRLNQEKQLTDTEEQIYDFTTDDGGEILNPTPAPARRSRTKPASEDQPIEQFELTPVTDGSVKVLNTTRDKVKNIRSVPGARIISQDFNDADNRKARGIEIKVPKDATKEEIFIAKQWAKETQKLYKELGVSMPLRGDQGIKRDGRGKTGFFHMEDHFKFNKDAREAIKNNPEKFAAVTARTLGTMRGATFLNPHKSNDPGAIGDDGIGEREFSQKYRTPFLQEALQTRK